MLMVQPPWAYDVREDPSTVKKGSSRFGNEPRMCDKVYIGDAYSMRTVYGHRAAPGPGKYRHEQVQVTNKNVNANGKLAHSTRDKTQKVRCKCVVLPV